MVEKELLDNPMDKPSWDKLKWRLIKNHLKYSKGELALFKGNPRNEAVLDKGRDLQSSASSSRLSKPTAVLQEHVAECSAGSSPPSRTPGIWTEELRR